MTNNNTHVLKSVFFLFFLCLWTSQCSHADVNVGNPKSGDVLNSSSLLVYFKEKTVHFVVYISKITYQELNYVYCNF